VNTRVLPEKSLCSKKLSVIAMIVVFLGTAGSIPTVRRNSPAIAIRRGAELLLFDCGEGTQRQIARAKIGLRSKMRILITHMHGDHILGLPGLIQTMSLFDRKHPLEVYGPAGICAFIKAMKETVKFSLTFSVEVREIGEGVVYQEKDYFVESVWTKHSVPSLAYAIVEKARPGRFLPDRAGEINVPKGPLWSALQQGNTVINPQGKVIEPEMVLGPLRRGRRLVYSSDTAPCSSVEKLTSNADLLIHEATFTDDYGEKAIEMGHSTPSQAAQLAKRAGVLQLVLTHISGRYNEDDTFLDCSKRIFPNVVLAEDLMSLRVRFRD
jgi:ribonuclease Z